MPGGEEVGEEVKSTAWNSTSSTRPASNGGGVAPYLGPNMGLLITAVVSQAGFGVVSCAACYEVRRGEPSRVYSNEMMMIRSLVGRGCLFVYGSLMAEEVLVELLGRMPACRPASISGFSRKCLRDEPFPAVIRARPGDVVDGFLVEGLSQRDLRALDFYEDDGLLRTACSCLFPL